MNCYNLIKNGLKKKDQDILSELEKRIDYIYNFDLGSINLDTFSECEINEASLKRFADVSSALLFLYNSSKDLGLITYLSGDTSGFKKVANNEIISVYISEKNYGPEHIIAIKSLEAKREKIATKFLYFIEKKIVEFEKQNISYDLKEKITEHKELVSSYKKLGLKSNFMQDFSFSLEKITTSLEQIEKIRDDFYSLRWQDKLDLKRMKKEIKKNIKEVKRTNTRLKNGVIEYGKSFLRHINIPKRSIEPTRKTLAIYSSVTAGLESKLVVLRKTYQNLSIDDESLAIYLSTQVSNEFNPIVYAIFCDSMKSRYENLLNNYNSLLLDFKKEMNKVIENKIKSSLEILDTKFSNRQELYNFENYLINLRKDKELGILFERRIKKTEIEELYKSIEDKIYIIEDIKMKEKRINELIQKASSKIEESLDFEDNMMYLEYLKNLKNLEKELAEGLKLINNDSYFSTEFLMTTKIKEDISLKLNNMGLAFYKKIEQGLMQNLDNKKIIYFDSLVNSLSQVLPTLDYQLLKQKIESACVSLDKLYPWPYDGIKDFVPEKYLDSIKFSLDNVEKKIYEALNQRNIYGWEFTISELFSLVKNLNCENGEREKIMELKQYLDYARQNTKLGRLEEHDQSVYNKLKEFYSLIHDKIAA